MNEQVVNVNFVAEVEKRPLLYNYTLSEYSRKDLKEKAWSEVVRECGITVVEAKEKWKNLRAVFVRHMKPGKSGSGAQSKKPYYLAEAMQFALPYVKALSKATGNLPNVPQEDAHGICDDVDPDGELESQSSVTPCPALPTPLVPPTSPPLISHVIPKRTVQENTQGTKEQRSRIVRNNAIDSTFIDYFKAKQAKLANTTGQDLSKNPRTEGLKMFLLSLLPDLESMSDSQIRQFKRRCLQIIDDILSVQTTDLRSIQSASRISTPYPPFTTEPLNSPSSSHSFTTSSSNPSAFSSPFNDDLSTENDVGANEYYEAVREACNVYSDPNNE